MKLRHIGSAVFLVASLTLAGWTAPLPAATASQIKTLRLQAELYEQQAHWDKACLVYETILYHQRNLSDIRDRYRHCLRRYFQLRRHRDPSFQKEVLTLGYAQSLRLYQLMLAYLSEHALDKQKATPEAMFRKGLEELHCALDNPAFVQMHATSATPQEIYAFRLGLKQIWGHRTVTNARQAGNQVREVALAALQKLRLNTTVVVMEFVCGSCYAVDDYTMYLTPAELRQLCDSLKGETVGVGLTLGLRGDRIIIKDVLSESPAAEIEPPLLLEDRLLSIAGRPTASMSLEAASELLQGAAGSEVELVVESGVMGSRLVTLRRRAVFLPSVSAPEVKPGAIGYIAIRGFSDATVQELDAALATLIKSEVRALVLDLRGNGGGVVNSAIDAARRFLPSGVITSIQSDDARQNTTYYARNAGALMIPLVVLIDGDTASAAEILAGALKENQRARLVGQSSFGKSCLQEVLRLSPSPGNGFPGGLRITVSRFLSPSGVPYTGRGVEPHIFVERFFHPDSLDPIDHQIEAGMIEAQRLVDTMPQ